MLWKLLGTAATLAVCAAWLPDLRGDYCRTLAPTCCPGRRDSCSVPILGTLCYCDLFCNRTARPDCCPDFFEVCHGVRRPDPTSSPLHTFKCVYGGQVYYPGNVLQINCNKCTCQQTSATKYDFVCDQSVCLVRPDLIEQINKADIGWTASNYTMFWGKTLEEGVRYRLGTFRPGNKTISMNEISMRKRSLPQLFDSRQEWPNLLQPIRDQGDCGSSWAFSTTALAADRLAIQSLGADKLTLSPQQMVSCQTKKQKGCQGGHLDRAWWYMRKHGVSEEECFPYHRDGSHSRCAVKRVHRSLARCEDGRERPLYKWTPPYRIQPTEEAIMQEIATNGPVQAVFRVMPDFFLYRGGVYRHGNVLGHLPEEYRHHGWHSVRIMGWGEDNVRGQPVKYWLCANSWGRLWGENGYFRVVRGRNEADIESFVVGVWARRRKEDRRTNMLPRQ